MELSVPLCLTIVHKGHSREGNDLLLKGYIIVTSVVVHGREMVAVADSG